MLRLLRGRVRYGLRLVLLATPLSLPTEDLASTGIRQQSNDGVDVVIVAHADDWQAFMGDAILDRINSGRQPVFIYLTAGDDGRTGIYWRQRESAALQSTRVALGVSGDTPVRCDSVSVNVHRIAHCTIGVSESYFLRLPDGNRNGAGFARNGFESLRKLRRGSLSISAVDSSARYRSWQDLNATVAMLVRMVADSTHARVMIHTTDPSIRINPHDHYDHRMAGKLSESLLYANGWQGRYYVGYALATRAPNRSETQQREKTEVFSAYDREMMLINPAWSAYREHPRFYADCMQRTYSRSVGAVSSGPRR